MINSGFDFGVTWLYSVVGLEILQLQVAVKLWTTYFVIPSDYSTYWKATFKPREQLVSNLIRVAL